MSLYGNDPAMTHIKLPQPQETAKREPERPATAPDGDDKQYREPHAGVADDVGTGAAALQQPNAAPCATGAPRKVLGETIGNGSNAAVNETLGKQQGAHIDIASRIHSMITADLRHSIGLNDRFLLIRDLFGGNAEQYEETITILDAFADLDEAMIHISETYSWNPDSDGVKLLIELLERKLG